MQSSVIALNFSCRVMPPPDSRWASDARSKRQQPTVDRDTDRIVTQETPAHEYATVAVVAVTVSVVIADANVARRRAG
ncbi:hypothetical protein [Streptomyces sp. NBC_00963]|uniref:hypothetical protein n=1 Tax=Streptomyces sp. NBC_00963 TaxID=2903697 RepID=UPI0038675A9D